MLLNFKKRENGISANGDLVGQLQELETKSEFFMLTIQSLIQFIKEFALDLKEIESDAFKQKICELSKTFTSETRVKKLESTFRKRKKAIGGHAIRQRDYLKDRETEFRDIIDILTKAMVTVDSENQEYNLKILKQGEKIEQITLLDDIKKVKQALIDEVEHIRETVKDKQNKDSAKLQLLSRQVKALNVELKKARTESELDGMTGIFNRKTFDGYLSEIIDSNAVYKSSFSLLLIDIDDFKNINDTYGHQTGDRVIITIVNKCRGSIRNEDFLARYGGEEFALILPGASLKNAEKKARQLCKTIGQTRYALDSVDSGQTLSVTISIGVSAYQRGDTAASILKRTDAALYAAKGAGKNRVFTEKKI